MAESIFWMHSVKLTVHPVSASLARGFVREHLVSHDLAHLVDDVELVASELATNALLHAQTPFTVTLQAFERTVLLEVQDGSQADPCRVVARGLDTGGRGIAIVGLLSRDWGVAKVANGGKSVWAEFDRCREAADGTVSTGDRHSAL